MARGSLPPVYGSRSRLFILIQGFFRTPQGLDRYRRRVHRPVPPPAASLHVAVFSPTGELIHEGTGGLVLLQELAPPARRDEIELTTTAGSSSLSYDAATGRYTYLWKTEKSWAGTCRQLALRLTDGTTHTANFKVR